MFLVIDPSNRSVHVFLERDPRRDDGFPAELRSGVVANVTLEQNGLDLHRFGEGDARPAAALGQSGTDPMLYRVFRSPEEAAGAGFYCVAHHVPEVAVTWAEYQAGRPNRG